MPNKIERPMARSNTVLGSCFKQWLPCILALFFVLGCSPKIERPNVVLIMADDLGYSDLGSYGSEIETPNLDRLTEQGVQFTQFYNVAKCTQSRASLLTGLYHQQTENLRLSKNNSTIAEILGQNGYETIISGKWHLGNWRAEITTPTSRGFDQFFGFLGGAINYFTGEDWGTGENYMRYNEQTYSVGEDFYATNAFTDYAIEQISRSDSLSNPFFLYLSYNAPHFPLQVPVEETKKYREVYRQGWDHIREARLEKMKKMGLLNSGLTLSQRDSLVPAWNTLSQKQQEEEIALMATYAGMIDRMDQQIGRVLDHLDGLGLSDNTLVLFLSDNGACPFDFNRTPHKHPGPAESLRSYNVEWANVSNTPFRKYKQWMHEGGIATPLIMRWPDKIKAGKQVNTPGHIIDIMPTLLDATGSSYHTKKFKDLLPLEGKSLLPLVKRNIESVEKPMFWEFNGSRAVRKGPWKLVAERGGHWELYNIEEDRTEQKNLINEKPKLASKLKNLYDDWADRVDARSSTNARSMPLNRRASYTFE